MKHKFQSFGRKCELLDDFCYDFPNRGILRDFSAGTYQYEKIESMERGIDLFFFFYRMI